MTDVMTLRARVRARLDEVHRALTDATELRTWLAEHAEVALPDRYAFWGPSVPEGDAPRQHPLHVDERTVRFGWQLDGQDTTAEIGLADDRELGTTVIVLSQSHLPSWADMMAEVGSLGVLHTYWSLSIANLVDHLEGRPLTPRADFTVPSQHAAVEIAARPERVWTALTDSDAHSRWFGARIGVEPWLGGRFAMGGFAADPEPGTLTEFEPGRRMTISWGDEAFTWELAGSGGRTRLSLTQSGFDPTRPPHGSWMGWLAGVAELRRFCELDGWAPIWSEVDVPGLPAGLLVEQD